MRRLVVDDPAAYGYLVDLSAAGGRYSGMALVGASPELLVARDGDRVHIVMLDVSDRRPVEDVLCTDAHYRRLFKSTGLELLDVRNPLATGKEATRWVSETTTSPWTIYVLGQLTNP